MEVESPSERKVESIKTLAYEVAVSDTPKLHALIYAGELDLNVMSTWLESAQKLSRAFCLNADKFFDSRIELTKILSPNNAPENRINREAFDFLINTWAKLETFDRQLNSDLRTSMVGVFQKLVEDVRVVKEQKKKLDKYGDKYVSALTRYGQLSPKKEMNVFEQESNELYETRIAYLQELFSYLASLKAIGEAIKTTSASKIVSCIEAEATFLKKSYEVFQELQPSLEQLKSQLEKKNEEFQQTITQIESQVAEFKQDVLHRLKPPHETDSENSNQTIKKTTVKEGYLWKKPKGIAKWERRYFTLQNQTFSYRSFSSERGFRGFVLTNNMGHCSVRSPPSEKIDRRFCFEFETNKQQFFLQAESESEMKEWVSALENAIQLTFSQANLLSMLDMKEKEKEKENENEEDEKGARGKYTVETIKYPQPSYERKNKELHEMLKSIPGSDFVFDSCSCAIHREIPVHGKLYLTQNRIIFASALAKILRNQIIYISEITSIETSKKSELPKTLQIVTPSQKYIFSFWRARDLGIRDVIVKMWMWQKENKRQEVTIQKIQELYDNLYKGYEKIEQKDEDSDSSLDDNEIEEAKTDPETKGETSSQEPPVPADIILPQGEVTVDIEPLADLVILNEVFAVPVQRLHSILTDLEDPVLIKFNAKRGTKDYKAEPWKTNAEGNLERNITNTIPLNLPMGKNSTDVYETQTYLKKEDYVKYVMDVKSSTPNAPYGDTFDTHLRYILTFVSKTSCRLNLSLQIEWKKNTAFKGMITKGITKGIQQLGKDLVDSVKKEAKNSRKGSGDQSEAEEEREEEERKIEEEKKQANKQFLLYFTTLSILLLISICFNLYGFFWRQPQTFDTVGDLDIIPTQISRFMDLEQDILSWTSIEKAFTEETFVSLREELSTLRKEIVGLYHFVDQVEEKLFQSQAIDLMVEKVRECHTQVLPSSKGHVLTKKMASCFHLEYLLREFLKDELAKNEK